MIRRRNAHEGESPAVMWWARDWLTSETVLAMPRAARSLYFDLLLRQWIDGSIPSDTKVLAALTGESHGAFLKLWKHVACCFEAGADGRLRNERMERERKADEEYRSAKSKAGAEGAAKRWQTHSRPMAGATDLPHPKGCPSSSSSSSSSHSSLASQVPLGGGSAPPARSYRRASKRTERGALHQAAIDWWCETFQAVCGRRYGFDHDKDGKQVKAILSMSGVTLDDFKDRALILLHAAPEWIDEGGRDLATLRSQWNRLVSMGTGRTSGSKQLALSDAARVPQSSGLLDMPSARKP